MPIRALDPFSDPTQHMKHDVNPFLAELIHGQAQGSLPVAYGPKLAAFPGHWREQFGEAKAPFVPHRLVAEIGCHKGEVLKQMALHHPDTGFVGVDITFKRVVTTARRAQQAGLNNIISILANAAMLDKLFAPDELDGLVIFFPDPWVKKRRQIKNRLLTKDFCAKITKVLRPGGFFWLKTDQQPYFANCEQGVLAAGLTPIVSDDGLVSETYTSTFESHFRGLGLPTYQGVWVKLPNKT